MPANKESHHALLPNQHCFLSQLVLYKANKLMSSWFHMGCFETLSEFPTDTYIKLSSRKHPDNPADFCKCSSLTCDGCRFEAAQVQSWIFLLSPPFQTLNITGTLLPKFPSTQYFTIKTINFVHSITALQTTELIIHHNPNHLQIIGN